MKNLPVVNCDLYSIIFLFMSSDYATKITSMLEQGQDPKDFMIEVCKPSCKNYEDKLRRC